jgi:hypothetical protein
VIKPKALFVAAVALVTILSEGRSHALPLGSRAIGDSAKDLSDVVQVRARGDKRKTRTHYAAPYAAPYWRRAYAGSQGGGVSLPPPSLMSAMSDSRLKEAIVPLKRLANGIELYRFRYKGTDQPYVGVMAQQVEPLVPDAVSRGSDGYLRVDYGRLGLKLMTWAEWQRTARQ